MIKGVGTDIIEIQRLQEGYEEHGQPFLDRIYTKKEQLYCREHKDPYPRFAGRFAAKEAIVKALGVGFGASIGMLDLEILSDEKGKPCLILSDKGQELLGSSQVHLSISHCKTYATAVAICESEK